VGEEQTECVSGEVGRDVSIALSRPLWVRSNARRQPAFRISRSSILRLGYQNFVDTDGFQRSRLTPLISKSSVIFSVGLARGELLFRESGSNLVSTNYITVKYGTPSKRLSRYVSVCLGLGFGLAFARFFCYSS